MHIPVKSGALVPLLIMLPNLIWFLLPPATTSATASAPPVLNIAENIGRVAIIVIPLFYSLNFKRRFSTAALVVCILALVLYYVVWGRYFIEGRTPELLGAAFIGIPLPLAVAPVVLLISSSYLMGSWPMLAASLFFGTVHTWVSALTL